MNTTDLIDEVAKRTGLTKADSKNSVNHLINIIRETLKNNEEVRLNGLGTFYAKEQAARQGRNPQTGAALQIPASTQGKFRAAKELKDTLNSK